MVVCKAELLLAIQKVLYSWKILIDGEEHFVT
jgi:hypothetical protein